jgi:hypothetical protein
VLACKIPGLLIKRTKDTNNRRYNDKKLLFFRLAACFVCRHFFLAVFQAGYGGLVAKTSRAYKFFMLL